MKKSEILVIPPYGKTYVDKASDEDLLPQLQHGGISLFMNHADKLQKVGTKVYARGKWTVPQIIEHIADAERVFQYRALRFARQDKTELSGFEEDMWAAVSKANDRPIQTLLKEYEAVRASTLALYQTFQREEYFFTGKANGMETSVIALGFMMIGHAVHHFEVIQQRYFPLIEE